MTKPSAGGTVTQTTTGESSRLKKHCDDDDDDEENVNDDRVPTARSESKPVPRKRRRNESASPRSTGIPRKTPRRTGEKEKSGEHESNGRVSPIDVSENVRNDVKNDIPKDSSLAVASNSENLWKRNDERNNSIEFETGERIDNETRTNFKRKQNFTGSENLTLGKISKKPNEDIPEGSTTSFSLDGEDEDEDIEDKCNDNGCCEYESEKTIKDTKVSTENSIILKDKCSPENRSNISGPLNDSAVKKKFKEIRTEFVEVPEYFCTISEEYSKNCDEFGDEKNNCDDKSLGSRNDFIEDAENYGKDEEEQEDVSQDVEMLSRKPPIHPDVPRRRLMGLAGVNRRRDDSARLRKTIQWLEEGARKLREDLAETRAELHEERRAARLARREIEIAVRETKAAEMAKHQRVISELKTRLSQSPSRSMVDSNAMCTKTELLKDENHRREISAVKKRLAEADATIRKLRSSCHEPPSAHGNNNGKRRRVDTTVEMELRKLDGEVKTLRGANRKLEEKLNIVCTEAEKIRTMELRIQHENHEAELNALRKSLRIDAVRMMDEIRNKDREIEKLRRINREKWKPCGKEDDNEMRKLRENENGHQIRLAARIEDKIPRLENVIDLCKGECDAVAEVERLRELAVEQQEVIEVLRQAVKEKERKLDQLLNKKRKEEFYKQWLELEPVAEVDDEEEHEEGDSALSSAPSSLSPQPGGCGQWQNNGVTREAYEAVLLEVDELQTKFLEEQQELVHAKTQVRDLEKALLQETRGSQNSRRALMEKLRKIEEREASLLAEISELREQNELLEFRVLELEESPGLRETSDTADSGIVSPEPIHIFKQEQNNKQRDRAVATVLPFSAYTHPASPVLVQKSPLSLQESGIFEDEEENEERERNAEEEEEEEEENDEEEEVEDIRELEVTSCGTQTEAPVGELLQEVQRLQELRERIQERAVKVPSSPAFEVKSNPSSESEEMKTEHDKSSSYRERIRKLEERLSLLEEEEANRTKNDLVVKQREEDLLDENYRLTERVYWLENELRSSENSKKICVNAETMTEANNSLVHVETMTDASNKLLNVETMTEDHNNSWNAQTVSADSILVEKESFNATKIGAIASDFQDLRVNQTYDVSMDEIPVEISSLSRCEKIFHTALQEKLGQRDAMKSSRVEIGGFRVEQELKRSAGNEEVITECPECEKLRKDYDEKIQQLAKAECRFRGRLVDLERKEGAFVKTLKQVDVTWSQLEADHAKKLEEIGRKLEEKVECNRRIMERVAELEMLRNQEQRQISCRCTSSTAVLQNERNNGNSDGMDEVDAGKIHVFDAMDVDDGNDENNSLSKMKITDLNETTHSDRPESIQCQNCRTVKDRIGEKESGPLRRIFENVSSIKTIQNPAVDGSTEMAVEAKEDSDEKSMSGANDGVSRFHVSSEEERPAPEPTENLRLTNNESELEKKVRKSWRNERVGGKGEGWLIVKTWNTESYNRKARSSQGKRNEGRRYVFRNGGLRYVLYPEICV